MMVSNCFTSPDH